MLFKSTLALAFAAFAHIVAAGGQPPACVVSVMGNTPNPADLSTICGTDAKKIEAALANACGDQFQTALKFFTNTCKTASHPVEAPTASATASGAPTSATGFVTAVVTSGTQATATATGAHPGAATGSATGGAAATPSAAFTGGAAVGHQLPTSVIAVMFLGAAALL